MTLSRYKMLLEPYYIGSVKTRNRIVVPRDKLEGLWLTSRRGRMETGGYIRSNLMIRPGIP